MYKLFFLFFIISYHGVAFSDEIGMVTGGKGGTYYPFGQDIAKYSKPKGVKIKVRNTKGTVDNIDKMISSDRMASLGIVQSDIMNRLLNSSDNAYYKMAKKLKMIFPLYNEEVHILALKKIRKLSDLNNKHVYIGSTGSGTNLTATTIFDLLKITPIINEHLEIKKQEESNDPDIGILSLLASKKIDAIFYVAGQPQSLLSNTLIKLMDMEEDFLANIHFLPINEKKLLKGTAYVAASINHPKYNYLTNGEEIPTIAVKAMLVGYDFSPSSIGKGGSKEKVEYYRTRCHQIYKIAQAIKENLPNLQRHGHDKWKTVRLEENIGMWETHKCSARDYIRSCETNGSCFGDGSSSDCNKIRDPARKIKCVLKK